MSNEFFRSIKSSHEELEVFFQIMFFYKIDKIDKICFDIKEYLFRRTALVAASETSEFKHMYQIHKRDSVSLVFKRLLS